MSATRIRALAPRLGMTTSALDRATTTGAHQ